MSLNGKQYRSVLDLVGDAHDAQDLDELRGLLLPALKRLVPADYSSYNEVTASGTAPVAIVQPQPCPAFAYEAWERLATTNPLIGHFTRTRDTRPYRFSDVADMRVLRATPLFRELYARSASSTRSRSGSRRHRPSRSASRSAAAGRTTSATTSARCSTSAPAGHRDPGLPRRAQLRERLSGAVDAAGRLENRGIAALVVEARPGCWCWPPAGRRAGRGAHGCERPRGPARSRRAVAALLERGLPRRGRRCARPTSSARPTARASLLIDSPPTRWSPRCSNRSGSPSARPRCCRASPRALHRRCGRGARREPTHRPQALRAHSPQAEACTTVACSARPRGRRVVPGRTACVPRAGASAPPPAASSAAPR